MSDRIHREGTKIFVGNVGFDFREPFVAAHALDLAKEAYALGRADEATPAPSAALPALPPGTALEVEDLKKIFGNQNVQTFVAGGLYALGKKMLDEHKAKKADDE